jgi:RNA polymerase sigma factor (sigma-70 family)
VTTIQPSNAPPLPTSDERLLAEIREGASGSFGILYGRYRAYALTVARTVLPRVDSGLAEDVVESSFARILAALRNGKGPTDTLQHYLVTTVRREAWRALERQRHQRDLAQRVAAGIPRGPEGADETALVASVVVGQHLLLATAFGALPLRWRHVLRLTEIEGRKAAEVGDRLGLSASSASALAYRARRGLIVAYVEAHQAAQPTRCAMPADELVAYLFVRQVADRCPRVVAHLEGCSSCRDLCRGVDTLSSGGPGVPMA